MTVLITPFSASLAALLGVTTYVAYFNRGEHHMMAIRYIQAALLSYTSGVLICTRYLGHTLSESLFAVFILESCFIGAVYTSLIIYRLFFHPLNRFPGTIGARLSDFWYTFQLGDSKAHFVISKLHQKFGDFVRIGSSSLSIAHPDAFAAIYGPGSKCTKSDWYDTPKPQTSMHTERDRTEHDKRRRVWSPAFSDKALRGYEERIAPYNDKLVEQIRAFGGQPIDVSKWFNYYSYDVMGDLGLGKSFRMLEDGKAHWAISLLNEGMELVGFNLPAWFVRILISTPGLAAGHWKFIRYCSDELDQRINNPPKIADVVSALLAPFKDGKPKGQELQEMQGDSRLLIVAGSDTTAATLTHLFYHLAEDPSQVDKLREELQPFVTAEGDVANVDIQNCNHLNGSINETLRLHPPVPTAIRRKTPPEGLHVGNTFIPGNMDVWAPAYVVQRRSDIFPNSLKFYPERWYSDQSAVKNKTSFAPFLMGPYSCIGKPLALLELRTVTTKLIMNFDVSFARGEDGYDLLNNTRDHFTLGLGKLNLVFKPRVG